MTQPSECCHCGGVTEWFSTIRNRSQVVDGRLKTSDVDCVFVRGCTECSETLEVRTADDVAASMSRIAA